MQNIQNEEIIDYQSYYDLLEENLTRSIDNEDINNITKTKYTKKEKDLFDAIFHRLSYILGRYDSITSVELTVIEADDDYETFKFFSNILNRLLLESREDLLAYFQNRTSIILSRNKHHYDETLLVTVDYKILLKIYETFSESPIKKHIKKQTEE